jgi:glycopeptide antibiotics resistance protein
MKKTIFIIFGLILGFFIFMPKTNLIYFIQKELSKQNIYLNTDISSHLFSITLNKSTLYYNGINTANIDDIEIYPFILYNKITANNIKLNIGNYKIKNLKIIYNVFSPKKFRLRQIPISETFEDT